MLKYYFFFLITIFLTQPFCSFCIYFLLKEKVAMKFFKKTLLNKKLGVSVAVSVNGNCKADGG